MLWFTYGLRALTGGLGTHPTGRALACHLSPVTCHCLAAKQRKANHAKAEGTEEGAREGAEEGSGEGACEGSGRREATASGAVAGERAVAGVVPGETVGAGRREVVRRPVPVVRV